MRSPHTMEGGKLGVAVYGVHAEHDDLEFRLRGADLIQVPLQGGGTAQFFANGNTDLQFEGEGDAAMLQLVWRPANGLHYGLRFGTGDYEVRVPSGSVENVLENASPGTLWGAEVGWTLLSDTPVTPAVGLSLGYNRADYAMRRLRSSGLAPVPVDQRFSLETWQVGVSASNRWKWIEPYAGLRLFRQAAALRDNATAERVRGTRDGFSPYGGLKIEFFPREALVIEVAGVDETLLSAGLAVGF